MSLPVCTDKTSEATPKRKGGCHNGAQDRVEDGQTQPTRVARETLEPGHRNRDSISQQVSEGCDDDRQPLSGGDGGESNSP